MVLSNPKLKVSLITWFYATGILCSGAVFAADDILGGSPVTAKDSIEKSVVALVQTTAQDETLCSATLIAKDMALTAAHCVENGIDGMTVNFGSLGKGVTLPVIGSEVPDQWTQGTKSSETKSDRGIGDIAVIRLEGKIPAGFHPAHFLSKKHELSDGEEAVLAGFGITDADEKTGAGTLRKATVSIAQADFDDTEILFDQTQGAGACHGDSGGPAFLRINGKYGLFGVTSRSYPETAPDDCAHQVIYTKTKPYRKWITQAMKDLREKTETENQ
jgi:hypothetical protein